MDAAELFSVRGKTAVVTGGSRASAYLTGVVLPVSGGIATID